MAWGWMGGWEMWLETGDAHPWADFCILPRTFVLARVASLMNPCIITVFSCGFTMSHQVSPCFTTPKLIVSPSSVRSQLASFWSQLVTDFWGIRVLSYWGSEPQRMQDVYQTGGFPPVVQAMKQFQATSDQGKSMGVSIVMGIPQKWMVYFMENPIYKYKWIIWGYPRFQETPIWVTDKIS